MLPPESSSTLPTVTVVSGRPFVVFSLVNPRPQQSAHPAIVEVVVAMVELVVVTVELVVLPSVELVDEVLVVTTTVLEVEVVVVVTVVEGAVAVVVVRSTVEVVVVGSLGHVQSSWHSPLMWPGPRAGHVRLQGGKHCS